MSAGSARIDFIVEDAGWRKCGVDLARLRRAAELAARRGRPQGRRKCEFSVLLADDARMQSLNSHFRGTDCTTNVLSFPAAGKGSGYLGDIAVGRGATLREAARAGKSPNEHAAHLLVHGVLHLLGYDHRTSAEAGNMESLEIAILRELAIPNPYACNSARK